MWRRRRTLLNLGLLAAFAPLTFYFIPNWFLFHRLTRPTPADFVQSAQRAIPIVIAVKDYQYIHGQLPQTEMDFDPKHSLAPHMAWEYWQGKLWVDLAYHQRVIYDFTPGAEHWEVRGVFTNGTIPLPPVRFNSPTLSTTRQSE
jgi:hypothetical protein